MIYFSNHLKVFLLMFLIDCLRVYIETNEGSSEENFTTLYLCLMVWANFSFNPCGFKSLLF